LLALRELRPLQSRTRIIMMVDEEQPGLVMEAYRNGARGVFCRSRPPANLRKCILSVYKGGIWASNHQLEWIIQTLMQVPARGLPAIVATQALSKREEQIARMAASGMSNREISQNLQLSSHTVKNNLFRAFRKLGISTRIELVLYILSQPQPSEIAKNADQNVSHKLSA
jgi:two-component system, NarL family, nitrate/nitrite response regulator NarL